jgi:hypothetical protein
MVDIRQTFRGPTGRVSYSEVVTEARKQRRMAFAGLIRALTATLTKTVRNWKETIPGGERPVRASKPR